MLIAKGADINNQDHFFQKIIIFVDVNKFQIIKGKIIRRIKQSFIMQQRIIPKSFLKFLLKKLKEQKLIRKILAIK